MPRMHSPSLVLLSTLVLVVTLPAFAQRPGGTDKSPPSTSGNGLWDVLKCDLSDWSENGDKVVANFSSEQEARAYAEQLNKENKQWMHYTYCARKRSTIPDSPPKDSVLPRERPGGNKTESSPSKPAQSKGASNKPPSVAGKKVSATVGKSKVIMEFKGRGDRGDLRITGELEETGKWTQDGAGILAETEKSRFRGKISEDGTVAGLHFTKGGSHPSEWRLSLGVEKRPAADTLAGTSWIDDGGWVMRRFEKDGKYQRYDNLGRPRSSGLQQNSWVSFRKRRAPKRGRVSG
jgi:hypothetical protein